MSAFDPGQAAILVAADNAADAEQIGMLLAEEFDKVFTTIGEDKAVADFERHRPGVLVLAFTRLEETERYYLGLCQLCPAVRQTPHRTVITCAEGDVKRVYDLCRKSYFDDYVILWPVPEDVSRLAMAVHHALGELALLHDGGPSMAEFAAQTRRLAALEGMLDHQLARGGRHVAAASRALARAEEGVGAAVDDFSRRLIEGVLADAVTVSNPEALNQEVSRLKREDVGDRFRTAAESIEQLQQWDDEFKQGFATHRASLRALKALADRVQPTVLVVDDDELQHKLVSRILEGENYRLLFAANGVEALSILRKTRPDAVLMDFMMPEMDGIEATRRLKAVPQFATLPVIMITGQSTGNVVIDSLKAGATGFLVKPFERDTLIAKLRQALNGA